jgi:phosphotransferase system enzyme I (PtsI)
VPAVAGLRNASGVIPPGALVAVDGSSGDVRVDPPADVLADLEARSRKRRAYERSLDEYGTLPAVTADGTPIRIEANVELPEEAARARQRGAEGIGLYRSEFMLAGARAAGLDEEAQYLIYCRLLDAMEGGRVTVRTFDVSESQLGVARPGEPSRAPLGLRGLRLSLSFDEVFQAQLRALLRAAAHGPLRIMFPFVTGVEELRAARAAVTQAAEALRGRGIAVPEVALGIMIEVPSAALTIDLLAAEADFVSIGTNDLIQYTLAVDRTDDRVSRMYEPLHPAILRILRQVAKGAARHGVPVSVCGEMAADPALLPLLTGLGLREFSMTPASIPIAKQVVRGIRVSDTVRLASRALKAATAADVEKVLAESMATVKK